MCTICLLCVVQEDLCSYFVLLFSFFYFSSHHRVGEDDLIEMATHICDADSDEGDWIPMYDITQEEKGASVKLDKQEYMGECRRECRTIASACAKVFDEYREDMAELLYKKEPKTLEKFSSRVCTKWAKVTTTCLLY